MVYTYEAEFVYDDADECWYVHFPDFDDSLTEGFNVNDAASNAADLLTLLIAERLDEGEPLPRPTYHEPPLSVVCVDVTPDVIEGTKLLTVTEAAEYLEVSPSRVSQLLTSGQLEARDFHGRRMVTAGCKRRNTKPATYSMSPHHPKHAATP